MEVLLALSPSQFFSKNVNLVVLENSHKVEDVVACYTSYSKDAHKVDVVQNEVEYSFLSNFLSQEVGDVHRVGGMETLEMLGGGRDILVEHMGIQGVLTLLRVEFVNFIMFFETNNFEGNPA